MSMKNALTPAEIEPATFWFVAQHLNYCATAVPILTLWWTKIDWINWGKIRKKYVSKNILNQHTRCYEDFAGLCNNMNCKQKKYNSSRNRAYDHLHTSIAHQLLSSTISVLYYKPAYAYLHMTSTPQGSEEQHSINFKNSAGRKHVWN